MWTRLYTYLWHSFREKKTLLLVFAWRSSINNFYIYLSHMTEHRSIKLPPRKVACLRYETLTQKTKLFFFYYIVYCIYPGEYIPCYCFIALKKKKKKICCEENCSFRASPSCTPDRLTWMELNQPDRPGQCTVVAYIISLYVWLSLELVHF